MQHNDGAQQQEGRISTTSSSIAALSAITTSHPAVSQLRVTGRVPVVTAAPTIGVVAAGQQGVLTTVAGARPVAMSPQAVMVPTQTVSRLLSPSTSLSANTVQIPATLNVLQRQLSAPGVVGLSAVSAQDLQQVLQQATQQSITLLTATEAVGEPQQRPRLARPLSFPHSSPTLPAVSSMSATGATIHHHGQSPVRGAVPVMAATLSHSNLQHSLLGMNLNPQQQQQLSSTQRRVVTTAAATTTTSAIAVIPAANITAQSRTVLEVRAPSGQPPSLRTASGAPPRKKMRLEEKQPPNAEVANYRKQLIELKHKQMKELKSEYFENLTEMFFLQNGQNLMDYHTWKKRPTPQLVSFLTSGKLDSDEEEDVLQVKEINSEVKVLTNPGSNVPLATPVAISTTLPPMVSALSQQVVAPSAQTASAGTTTTTLSATASQAIASSSALSSPSTAGTAAATSTSQLQQQLSKTQDPKAAAVKGQLASFKQVKSPPLSPNQRLHTRQQSLSAVYDNISGSSQEVIVERAKQEAEVVQRVAELRKEGLWSSKRLPRVQEPPRQKAHWDYLLEEMTWLAADFIQERKWKKAAARKVARMVSNYFKEQEQKELKAEKEEATKLKKIASHMAKMVKEFWTNIEKVVQYKQQMRLDEKKKRALDLHLNFIVDQTEKYSTWLTEGLQAASSVNGSVSTSPSHSSDGADFEPSENSTDDEETIQKEEDEAEGNEADEQQELEDLQKEGDLPLDELLKTLPQEVLDAPAPLPPPLPEGMEDLDSDDDEVEEEEEKKEEDLQKEEKGGEEGSKAEGDKGSSEQHEGSDKEFTGAEEEAVDVEDTIDEQEKHEKRDYQSELQDLADEGEMSIEELAAKYAGAYDSDFEMPQESSSEEEEESDSDLDSDQFEIESGSSSEQEQKEEEVETEKVKEESPGLEDLLKPQQAPEPTAPSTSTAAPQPEVKKEEKEEVINDIAAQALSLQPKGYTLETTEVRTKVPFLLKHKLREYQHVGLDWLATMHDKHLNGILADEMGLGKTIQTIALLAHLACEKGTWGPHLIVVPTSVMLNWEMELKKWCPSFKILTYYGNQKERKLKRQGWTKTNAFHVCITSYKLVVQDHQAFRRKKWKYLILDEAQNIKNFKSQRWQMLLNFSSQRRLLLTGTPLQNSLMELWSLMHFLMPNVFQSHRDFKEWFSNPLTGMIEGSQEYNESLIKRLHKVLRPFLLRRLKNEVEKQMPQKYEHVVMCRLSKRQRFLYDDFMSQAKTKETLASGHYMSVINILMQLRKVCNHPNLFDPRPVVSPLIMQGLTFSTASIVTTALHKDPLEEVDMQTLFPNLAEMERDLPAFVAHRVKQLKTAPGLIEEVDYHPDPPPPLPKGRLKTGTFPLSSALLQTSARASSPVTAGRAGSPVEVVKAAVSRSATPPVPTVSASVSSQSAVQSTPAGSATSAAVLSSGAVATISQVRPSSGQTLLLTSAARSGSSSALVLTTSPSMAIATAASAPTTPTVSSTLTSTLQAKVLPQPSSGSSSSGSTAVLSTQPITVQIQQTNQGTRLMIPTGQLSQLPANLFQIVQTSSGQHLVATSTPTSSFSAQVSAVLPVTSAASNTVNGPSTLTTVAATSGQGLVTTAVSQLKTLTALATTASTTVLSAVAPASSSTSSSAPPTCSVASSVTVSSASSKPVMRVSPMVASTSSGTVTVISTTTTTTTSTSSALPASVVSSVVSTLKSVMSPKKRSELFSEIVYERRKRRRREKLKRLARVNGHHCTHTPVYGPDLVQTLTLSSDLCSQCHREKHWLRAGHANCQCVHSHHNRNLPKYYWHETSHLSDLIRTPEQYLTELRDVLDRFAFCIPSVISPGVQLRVAHPDPSLVLQERRLELDVREQLRPTATRLNDLRMRMSMHFPELRLIQYDCGKLQTLDVLLRDLKSGGHRVLIFTQMTKMLDVLEAFLNYHGHRYLRLDGTTKVEQRQALMDRFNADRRIFCFILSTRSGGIGVNLTGADTVVFYDSDWNPTMDAQAQDRCHRIGQTRDVHIYRLISEMTVEENILKKANQKRLLGDLAIEGGNFTTAFFKEQTIKDLFAQPSGLKSLTEEKEKETEERKEGQEESMEVEEVPAVPTPSRKPGGKDKDASIVAAFEQALCKAEDETDAIAASLVKAEQKAELADFDESIPWDEKEAEARKEEDEMSRAELELAMLDKELTGIERYAVSMMETQMEDEVMEELKMAEEDIENSKKDWELTRLKALKEEEERRAKMEEDEMLYTYLRDDCQVFINALDGLEMPLWAPPTPPQDDNDVYVDQTMLFLHEGSIMSESQLPPVYVRKDHRKPRIETITTRKQKQRKEEAPRVPRSLFDRPSSALVKMRRELKMQRLKAAGLGLQHKQPMRPTSLPAPLSHKAPMVEQSEGHPEWLIHEDWALLQAVSDCCHLPLNLTGYQNGHIPNWDLVADVVNGVSRTHRSIKQCRARYENVIIPREEGRILYDVSPRKHKKNKATYKTKNNRPMKTSQLFTQDNYSSISLLYSLRFDSVKSMAGKRPAPMRQTLNNPTMKNPKHLVVLQDNHINYDQPLNPIQVAAIRAERIQREKKASSAANANAEAAQRPAQPSGTVGERGAQGVVQAVGGVAASAPTVAQAVAGHQLQSLVSAATPTTIIAGAATPRAAVAQGMPVSIARTLAASGNIVAVTGSLGRGRVQVHDITTVAGTVTGAQVAAQTARAATLQPTASASANITQKMAAMAASTSALAGGTRTVHQQIPKGLNQQINLLHPIMRSQTPGTATQAQQLGHKVRFTKQAVVRMPGITDEQLKALKVRQIPNKAQGGQQVKLQAAQILQGQVQQVGQSGTTSAAPVTLVKSVPAPAGASAIPVSINVTMAQGQQKTAQASRGPTVSQLQHHQRMQLLQQRKGVPLQQPHRVTALPSGVRSGQQIPLIVPSKTGQLTGQLLHQYIKQPAIISVTQASMVAKVSLPHSTPIHTLSAAAAGSPITVTQVAAAATGSAGGSGAPSHHAPTVATINMANVSAATHATVVKAATLATVDGGGVPKMATLAQSLVTPPPLQITSTALQPAQSATLVGPGGTQHRVLTATPTTLPQATAVVVPTTTLAQSAAAATTTVVQQQQQSAQQMVNAAAVVSAQAVASPGAMATVVTQTQSPQAPPSSQPSAQLTAQQQQQLQKVSPYAMRTRNQPKHS